MTNTFECRGLTLTRLWHCFGNEKNRIGIDVIEGLLDASRSNVLPINTHSLTGIKRRLGLQVGYGGVTFDQIRHRVASANIIPMLNINLQITSDAAVRKAQLAFKLTDEPILKLEVLTETHRTSNDVAVVDAYTRLVAWNSSLIVMPLLSTNYRHAAMLVDRGCPLLRVMGSAIGSCRGIENPAEFSRICKLGVPVVLDGGVGGAQDFRRALDAGATGVLINSLLFVHGADPVKAMRSFVEDSHRLGVIARVAESTAPPVRPCSQIA